MCLSTPPIPSVPQRQAAQAPTAADVVGRDQDIQKRRMAMAASMLTGPGGLGAPAATTTGAKTMLGS